MLPGGLVNPDETLEEGALREVKEETNLDVRVTSLIGFRELPCYLYGRYDLYFVFLMHTIDETQEIKMQEDEIVNYKWCTYEELKEFIPEMASTIKILAPYFNSEGIDVDAVTESLRE